MAKKTAKPSKKASASKGKPAPKKALAKKTSAKKPVSSKPKPKKAVSKPAKKLIAKTKPAVKKAKPIAKKTAKPVKKAVAKKISKPVAKTAPKKAVKGKPIKKAAKPAPKAPAKPVKKVSKPIPKAAPKVAPKVKPEPVKAKVPVKPEKIKQPKAPRAPKPVEKRIIKAPLINKDQVPEEPDNKKIPKSKYKKLEMEFPIHASRFLLFNIISTPAGLSEWFADDVNIRGNFFTFFWDGSQQIAELKAARDQHYVRFRWTDSADNVYFEFRIEVDELTGDVALIITDFVEDESTLESTRLLWQSQVERLVRCIGG